MTQEKSRSQDQESATLSHDPMLYKEAIDEAVADYEKSANAGETKELDPPTQKELGNVERALEDSLLNMEGA